MASRYRFFPNLLGTFPLGVGPAADKISFVHLASFRLPGFTQELRFWETHAPPPPRFPRLFGWGAAQLSTPPRPPPPLALPALPGWDHPLYAACLLAQQHLRVLDSVPHLEVHRAVDVGTSGRLHDMFMRELNSVSDKTLQLVFHCTSDNNIDSIVASGLDPERRSRDVAVLGAGFYFATFLDVALPYSNGIPIISRSPCPS